MSTTTENMQAAVNELRDSAEVQRLLEKLRAAHAPGQHNDDWDTPEGRQIEAALGHLQMALEAANR